MTAINTIIFDLGNVLVNWSPLHVFDEKYFDSLEKRDYFFQHICSMDWNEKQDEGRSIVEATKELIEQYPDWEQPIRDYYGRWTEMLHGPIYETVEIFRQLKESNKYKIYALTNWPTVLFDIALVRYNFLHWFDGRVVSGEEKTRKPFSDIYQLLLNRFEVDPSEAIFIDDSLRNIAGAEKEGISGIHFQSPQQLLQELKKMEIL